MATGPRWHDVADPPPATKRPRGTAARQRSPVGFGRGRKPVRADAIFDARAVQRCDLICLMPERARHRDVHQLAEYVEPLAARIVGDHNLSRLEPSCSFQRTMTALASARPAVSATCRLALMAMSRPRVRMLLPEVCPAVAASPTPSLVTLPFSLPAVRLPFRRHDRLQRSLVRTNPPGRGAPARVWKPIRIAATAVGNHERHVFIEGSTVDRCGEFSIANQD
jgi:hypothetical protein